MMIILQRWPTQSTGGCSTPIRQRPRRRRRRHQQQQHDTSKLSRLNINHWLPEMHIGGQPTGYNSISSLSPRAMEFNLRSLARSHSNSNDGLAKWRHQGAQTFNGSVFGRAPDATRQVANRLCTSAAPISFECRMTRILHSGRP